MSANRAGPTVAPFGDMPVPGPAPTIGPDGCCDESGFRVNGVEHAMASTVRSPQQRRLSALAATDAAPSLRTVVRAVVPDGRTARELGAAAEPVVHALFAATGLPRDEPFWLAVAGETLTLDLPAACADEPTALAVLREILGADPGGEPVPHTAAARWWDELSNASSAGPVREFWRARAAGWAEPVPAVLGGDDTGARPAEAVFDGAVLAGLRRARCSLSAWLLAGWQVVLRRHTDRDELVVGVATDLRRHEELAGCRGPLTAHLPVRARVPLSRPLAEHAEAAATDLAEGAQRAEWFDWARVLGDPTATGRPLPFGFDSSALPAPWDTAHGPVRVTGLVSRGDAFALWLHCRDAGDRVELRIGHDPALISAELAANLLDELAELLADALAAPDRPARELRLCPPELVRLLRDRGTGPTTTLPDGGLPGLVRATATEWPHRTATRNGVRALTYAELVSRMDGLTAALREHDVGGDEVVAVVLPAGVDLLVALLAVQAAGGAYAYLDPNQPAARLAALAEKAAARLVIADGDTEPPVPGLPVVPVGASHGAGAPPPVPLDTLAYVSLAPWSTGSVQVTHRGLLNHLLGIADDWARPTHALVMSMSAPADLALPALFLPLLSGGTVTFGSPGTVEPAVLADELAAHRYDLVCVTPSRLRTLRAELAERAAAGAPTPPLARCVAVGGEPLPADLARDWAAVAPGTTLRTYYGPAGTAGVRTHGPVEPATAGPTGTIPLGESVANTTVLVLDGALRPCPPAVTGELYVGGAGLARGYGGRPGATAARFVPDPDGPPGARLYRTGDLVRWLPGRRLELVARAGDQVELRGHLVDPAEVAAALADHPGVAEAVVTDRYGDGDRGIATLVAYAVAEAGPVPADELRAHTAARLPEHMVPTSVRWLDALPLGPGGKLDPAALPEPDGDSPVPTVAYAAPRTDTERVLAEIWAEALGLARVGVHDNFYAIGGDSILSILVASRAAKRGLKLSLRGFFAHQTIAAMAPYAEPVAAIARPGSAPPGLTPVQHWFFEQDPPNPATGTRAGCSPWTASSTPPRSVTPSPRWCATIAASAPPSTANRRAPAGTWCTTTPTRRPRSGTCRWRRTPGPTTSPRR